MSRNNGNLDSKEEEKEEDKVVRGLSRTGTPRPTAFKESLNAAFGILGIKKLPLNEAIANRQTELNQSDLPKSLDHDTISDRCLLSSRSNDEYYSSDSNSDSETDSDEEMTPSDSMDMIELSNNRLRFLDELQTRPLEDLILEYHYQLLDSFNGGDVDFVEYINADIQISKLIYFLSGEYAQSCELSGGRDKEVAKFAEFFLTSTYNTTVSDKLLRSQDLLDAFFACANQFTVSPQWCRVLFFITCESEFSVNLERYFGEFNETCGSSIEETKGFKILYSLFSQLHNPHIVRNLISLLTTNDNSVLYKSLLLYKPKEIIVSRLEYLSKKGDKDFNYNVDSECYNLCILLEEIIKRHISSDLYKDIISKEVISTMIEVMFVVNPKPLAKYCIDIFNTILELSFNNSDYETEDLPIIVNLLVNGVKQDNGEVVRPIASLLTHLSQPTLQFSNKSFGLYRLKEIQTINIMIQSNYGIVHKALFESDILTVCYNNILRYETNNVIHVKLSNILINVLYSERTDWLVAWLARSNLVNRIQTIIMGEDKKPYVPHLLSVCTKLKSVSDIIPLLKEYLHSVDSWNELYRVVEKKMAEYGPLGNGSHLKRPSLFSF